MPRQTTDPIVNALAKKALGKFGIRTARLTQLASRHNHVFRVDAPTGKRFVLRIQNDLLSDRQAQSQTAWMESLSAESHVRAPRPMRTSDGRAFAHVEMLEGRRRAVLLQWLPGCSAKSRADNVYRAAAELIARMHDHAEQFHAPRGFSCRTLDGEWLFGERFFIRASNAKQHLNANQFRIANRAAKCVRRAMKRLGSTRRRFGVIHADLNLDNIIFHRGRPSPIDFDEFGKGWYLFDLAELIRTSIRPDNWQQRKQVVLDAYTSHRPLDATELKSFNAFIVATFVQYLNWVFQHARNDQDLRWVNFCIDVIAAVTKYA